MFLDYNQITESQAATTKEYAYGKIPWSGYSWIVPSVRYAPVKFVVVGHRSVISCAVRRCCAFQVRATEVRVSQVRAGFNLVAVYNHTNTLLIGGATLLGPM